MSDCSPLRLAENGHSSPGQSPEGPNNGPSNSRSDRHHHHNHRSAQGSNHRSRDENDSVRNNRASSETSSSGRLQIRYGARDVVELIVPVSICMMIVVGTMKATDSYRYSSQTVIWYAQMMFTDQTVDTGTRVWQSFANAFILLIFIVVMTTILILLYKFRCYATIHGWLILSSLILLFMFAIMYIAEILKIYNIPMDAFTLAIFIWNFGVVGLICIHWKGPLLLQQGYLITISALLALVFIRSLPDWTTWTVLAIVSVWDLVAVLCPRGPLRILVETAQERNEAIFPALIYSSTMLWEFTSSVIVSSIPLSMADSNDNTRKSKSNSRNNNRRNRNRNNPETARTDQPQASSSRRSRAVRPNDMMSPTKRRSQHPVEIDYEDSALPPEVAIVQPSISGTSDEWAPPNVRANQRRSTDGLNDHERDRVARLPTTPGTSGQATATELTINFPSVEAERAEMSMEEERGVKLGLGDFIFYSLLVGKASSYNDWTITLSCYVAILVGLCVTLSLLAVFRKALPALPISIAIGLSTFFLSYVFVVPFAGLLAVNQVFI